MRRPVLLAALLAAGCGASPPRNGDGGAKPPPPGQELVVTSELEFSSLPIEGEIGTFEVWIRNATNQWVILRDLVQADVGSVMTWQVPKPGTLLYNPATDEFEYDPKRADKPRQAWNGSLLCPGEEIHLRPKIRMLHLPRRYRLNFFLLGRADLETQVYFEERKDRQVRYRRLRGQALDGALAPPARGAEDPKARPRVSSYRTVVFPHAETVLETPQQAPFVLDVRLDGRPFRLGDAIEKAGVTAEDVGRNYTYFAAQERWVLRAEKTGLVMVNSRGALRLPETNNIDTLFFLFDTMGDGSLSFAVRSPAGEHLRGFRLVSARECPKCRARHDGPKCPTCDELTVPSPEVPRTTTLRDCFKCKTRTPELRCEVCRQPTLGPEDNYKVVLHAGRTEITRLLKVLADSKLRIELVPDAGGMKLVIRR